MPGPVPLAPPVIVTQGTLLTTDQAHAAAVVTATVPLPAPAASVALAGVIA